MAYTDFTNLAQLEDAFGIEHEKKLLFDKQKLIGVLASEWLQKSLSNANRMPLSTEKAKSEAVIAPILEEIWEQSGYRYTYFSGFTFDVDKKSKLTGRCDFLFSKEPNKIEITAPVFCIIEAKDRTVEEGIPQAFASMYAAQIFNDRRKHPTPIMYGCVTNATSWLFLELHDKKLAKIDSIKYHTETELSLLLANFQRIIQAI